ncbi:MAG TPA: hypothetical protein VM345_00585 [Acidimicrobiales bacterium]|nr:hypothetical protein [Acidimicrobiales bacterium]
MPARAAAQEVGGVVEEATSAVGGWAVDRFFDHLAAWIADGLATIVGGVSSAMSSSTAVDPTAVWFSGPSSPYAAVRSAAAAAALLMVLASIVAGVATGDPGGMARRVLLGVPAAALATAVITVVTARALTLTDALSASILAPTTAGSTQAMVELFASASVLTNGAAGVIVAVVAMLAAIVVWVELLVRSALVVILIALSPLSFAAAIFPPARSAARRVCELLVAVVLSKLVIAVAFAVGLAALGTAGDEGMAPLVVGSTVLVLAAFSPFLVLRLFPLTEAATAGQSAAGMPVRAAQTTLAVAATAASVGRVASPSGDASVARLAGASRG